MHPINLSLLPNIECSHAWFRLDEVVAEKIRPLRRASQRIKHSIRQMWFSDSGNNTLAAEENGSSREGFLRAALTELASTEKALIFDLHDLGRSDEVLTMRDTPFPHLHLVRELRNYELHEDDARLSEFSRDLLWGNFTKPEEARPLTVSFWILEGITPKLFKDNRRKRRKNLYSVEEKRAMVEWFNDTQAKWGVHEVLLRAANAYGEALGARYFS